MKKIEYEELLNTLSSTGADFSEVFEEDNVQTTYKFIDSKLDNINIETIRGIGFRIEKDGDIYYNSTNKLDVDNLKSEAKKLSLNLKGSSNKKITLNELEEVYPKVEVEHKDLPVEKKKKIFIDLDKKIRAYSDLIDQVVLGFVEEDRDITIANSEGKFIKSRRTITRFICQVFTTKGDIKEKSFTDQAVGQGYEFLDKYNLEELALNCAKIAVEKLDAEDFKGGELPVILCPGFGAVIFHEACGHGLEATSVGPKVSVFSEDLGKVVASPKVTLVDDGTLEGCWGSNCIDDEGYPTKRNVLIENGVLKKYLVDKMNSKKMNQEYNGCGRRQSYGYPPTSRMSNTYLLPGEDKIEDMIKSIDLGVFCEKMSGGSVNPGTGEFNFAVDSAFLIENGKLTKRIKGITLIGTSKEILKNVEMVSNDLLISGGYCGSKSGTIPVTIGEPTIKVSKILVGGKE